jgi:hypothetical protein
MKKYSYLIIIVLISSLVLTGCLLSNVGQVPTNEQSGITYLTKGLFSGLVALWRFDEGGDITANDSSGNNNHGTLYNFSGTYWVDDQWGGQALSFDGVDEYVSVPDSTSLDLSGEITVEAWIKVAVHKNYNAIVIKGEDGAENYELLLTSSGLLYSTIKFTDGTRYYPSVPSAITDTEWHHVAMTYKPGEWRIYVDGVEKAERTDISKVPLTNNVPLFIGAEQYLGSFRTERFFNGLIDEVRIYDYALSPDTIADHHAAGIYGFNGLLAPYEPPPKAFKAGRSIPLKWQYTDNFSDEVDSSAAEPSVKVLFKGTIDVPADQTILVEDPGESGYRYDSDKKTWQFNWQTKDLNAGSYEIWVTSNQTGQVNGPFLIDLG